MMRSIYLFLFLFLYISNSFAQNQNPATGEVFRDDIVPTIRLYMSDDDLDEMLEEGNQWSNELRESTFIFDNGTVLDTVENVGVRLRGNTSRDADKKSFKVSFNGFESGKKYRGLEKMNINGEHNDPAITRAKIVWDLARDWGLYSTRANQVELYINDTYFGLYLNVEHIDENFIEKRFDNPNGNLYKCTWGANLNYWGSSPSNYQNGPYELKTNTAANDFSGLAQFIYILNFASDENLSCELEKVFNVDNWLKYMVLHIATGHWDDLIYNQNNYYLYENPATGKVEYLLFDLDNTLGVDFIDLDLITRNIYTWSPSNTDRAIYTRLLEVPAYRDRFSYYFEQFLETVFKEELLFPKLDNIREQIAPFVENDPFHSLDWGFSYDDFYNSYEQNTGDWFVPYGIKEYIEDRRESAFNQLEINDITPIISEVNTNYPQPTETIAFQANIIDDNTLTNTEICYQIDGQSSYTCIELFDDGLHQDGDANDGNYGTFLTAPAENTSIDYYIQATDNAGNEARFPRCEAQTMFVGTAEVALRINELMAANSSTITDENGEYEDWIELYNMGNEAIWLGDITLSDNTDVPNKWQGPDAFIQPDEYLVIWADKDPEQGAYHANFKLNSNGETITLYRTENNAFQIIDIIDYQELMSNDAFGRIPNGTGDFQAVYPSAGFSNWTVNTTEISDNFTATIAPNPCVNFFEISFNAASNRALNMRVYNTLGELVEQQKIGVNAATLKVDVRAWAAGIYVLVLENERGEKRVGKVMKL